MAAINWELVGIRALVLSIPLLIVVAVVLAIRQLRMPAARKFRRAYEGLNVSAHERPGTVLVQFHTYDGFLVWFTQTAHVVFAPPDDARTLLRRLVRHNLTWGMLSAGSVFVPVLTYFSARSQKASIAAQEGAIADGRSCLDAFPDTPDVQSMTMPVRKPSLIMKGAACVMVFLAVVFVIASVPVILRREWGTLFGMLTLAVFFGTFAREIFQRER